MKVLESVLEKRMRAQVEIDKMQFGFMPGKGIKPKQNRCDLCNQTNARKTSGEEEVTLLCLCGPGKSI